jgi:hypothetical protein
MIRCDGVCLARGAIRQARAGGEEQQNPEPCAEQHSVGLPLGRKARAPLAWCK